MSQVLSGDLRDGSLGQGQGLPTVGEAPESKEIAEEIKRLTGIVNDKQQLIVGLTQKLGEFVGGFRVVRKGFDDIKAGSADEGGVADVERYQSQRVLGPSSTSKTTPNSGTRTASAKKAPASASTTLSSGSTNCTSRTDKMSWPTTKTSSPASSPANAMSATYPNNTQHGVEGDGDVETEGRGIGASEQDVGGELQVVFAG